MWRILLQCAILLLPTAALSIEYCPDVEYAEIKDWKDDFLKERYCKVVALNAMLDSQVKQYSAKLQSGKHNMTLAQMETFLYENFDQTSKCAALRRKMQTALEARNIDPAKVACKKP